MGGEEIDLRFKISDLRFKIGSRRGGREKIEVRRQNTGDRMRNTDEGGWTREDVEYRISNIEF